MLLPDGTVTIPGFYDGVDKITQEQINKNKSLLQIDNPIVTGGVKATIGKHDFYTTVGLLPAIEVSGLQAGYTGEGYKNIIPAFALAKINFRLVASQIPEHFETVFRKYVADNTPGYIDYEITIDKLNPPVRVRIDSPEMKHIMQWQKEIYGYEPIIKNVGGGIPIVSDFKTILGIDTFLISLGNNDCHMHGVGENFRIDLIEKGLELSERILTE
jgi:acetylornithine deacetylase/succinyl-diaminopimelate desuccinylase-like protein